MAADNKEAASNEKAVTDAGALASAPILVSNITEEERASPEDNLLVAIAVPSEAITAGVVDA